MKLKVKLAAFVPEAAMLIRSTVAWVVAAGAIAFTMVMTRYGETEERRHLQSIAITAASSIDPEHAAALTGSSQDTGTTEYRSLQKTLLRIREITPGARFVYLMRRRPDGTFVFLADATGDGTTAGQPHGPADVLASASAAGSDPYSDGSGEWVSALAPVQPTASKFVTVLGIEVAAEHWRASVARYQALATTISALFMVLVLTVLVVEYRQRNFHHRIAARDGLTGIPNRRNFDEVLQREWDRAARERQPLSIIIADIDYFKRFNDRYGHLHGDACLRKVAHALRGVARRSIDLAARYGGEEFAIIMPLTDERGASVMATRLNHVVEDLRITHSDSSVSPLVTISAGYATVIPDSKSGPMDLIARADAALYRAKRGGRNQACGPEENELVVQLELSA